MATVAPWTTWSARPAPGAGHAADMDQPAASDAAVAGFLAGVDSQARRVADG